MRGQGFGLSPEKKSQKKERTTELLHGSRVDLNVQLSYSGLCEDVVRLAEDPASVCVRSHQQFERSDVNVRAQGPEVRLLEVIDPLQLLHSLVTLGQSVV